MNDLIRSIEAEQLKASVDDFSVGDTVRVHNKIREGNRERIQIFEGTVLKRQNGGARETFTVRKNSNGIGVEKTWPLHSPSVDRVEVVRKGKVRRAKLYYLRDRVPNTTKQKQAPSTKTQHNIFNFCYIRSSHFLHKSEQSDNLSENSNLFYQNRFHRIVLRLESIEIFLFIECLYSS